MFFEVTVATPFGASTVAISSLSLLHATIASTQHSDPM